MSGVLGVMLAGGSKISAFSITAGQAGGTVGYDLVAGLGSISGATLAGGGSITLVKDVSGSGAFLGISGWGGGQNGLQAITINGITLAGSAASSFTADDGNGNAVWNWSASSFGFANGVTYPGTVIN